MMSEQKQAKKTTLTPRMRFPGFSSSWAQRAIGSYIEECASRVSAATSLPIFTSSRSGLKPQEDYYGGQTLVNEGAYGVVPTGCFVYRHMSDDGLFVFNINDTGSDIAVSKEYPVFKALDIDSRFLLVELNHLPGFKAFALSQKAGGTRTRLYLSKLRTWMAPLPSIGEQQKIADCLTSLDEVIAAQGRIVAALKAHKRGLMQQLFPREGETRPRLRFPEFRNEFVWQVQRVEDVAAQGLTNGIFNDTKTEPGAYRLINVSEMYLPNPLVETDLVFAQAPTEDVVGKFVCYGDVFFTRSSLVREGIACSNIYLGSDQKTTFDGHLIRLRPNVRIVKPLFLHYALKSSSVRSQLVSKSKTATMTTIGQSDVAETMLSIPQLPEQQRIADCLSSLDAQITAESHQLATLKTHKQGLMQQLFPAPEGAAA